MNHFEPPINWNDYEDIALKLYERFGDDFNEGKIYRVRFTDLRGMGITGSKLPGQT
jgi:FeS assembly protein IscX